MMTTLLAVPFFLVPLNASICMCQSIQSSIQLAEQSPVSENCVNNSQCTGMECTMSLGDDANYTIESDIQSCSDPPGFLFTVRKAETGKQVFQHFFDRSTNATSLFNFPLIVVVIHRPYSVIIGVNWVIEDFPLPFIPRTQIILDKSNCTNETYPSPPTPISQVSCNAIKQVTINTYCRTNPACDTLDCIAQSYRSLYQILPCSNPPAIYVTLYDFEGNVIFNRAITNHTIVSLPYDFELMITVNCDKPDAIGLEAVIKDIIVTSYSIPVVPYTEIPIDSCVCPGVVCPIAITTNLPTIVATATSIAQTTTTSVTPTTASSIVQGSKNIIYAVIGSVVITATVTVIIMLVILAIVLMIRKGHRSKCQYNFQHLPFDGKDDSTEKMITADYKTVEESTVN